MRLSHPQRIIQSKEHGFLRQKIQCLVGIALGLIVRLAARQPPNGVSVLCQRWIKNAAGKPVVVEPQPLAVFKNHRRRIIRMRPTVGKSTKFSLATIVVLS